MRILGIDYGERQLGLALSDESSQFAFPKETVAADAALERIAEICEHEKVGAIVVGDTRAANGAENLITAQAESFMGAIHKRTGLTVHPVREAWSSVEASRFAPEGKLHDDAAAAAIILQRYLDSKPKIRD